MKRKAMYPLLTLVMALLISIAYAQDSTGVIRGSAFVDLNKNGVRDIGEPGLAETVICLTGPFDFVWCDHTEGAGLSSIC